MNYKRNSRIHLNFLNTIPINLFCCSEKFSKEPFPEKKEFYYSLNLEHTSEEEYHQEKRIYRDYEIKNLGEYHALYLRSDILLL